jgi:hypothetical protein
VSYRYEIFSWWWAHSFPKHVEKSNKYIKKNCAPSWLYLQDYAMDAWSTKHKKCLQMYTWICLCPLMHETFITSNKHVNHCGVNKSYSKVKYEAEFFVTIVYVCFSVLFTAFGLIVLLSTLYDLLKTGIMIQQNKCTEVIYLAYDRMFLKYISSLILSK